MDVRDIISEIRFGSRRYVFNVFGLAASIPVLFFLFFWYMLCPNIGPRISQISYCSDLTFRRYDDRSRRYVLDLGDTIFITKIDLETKIIG